MKKVILLVLIAIAMHNSYSQEDYYYNDNINPVVDTVPNYLKSYWGNTRISYVAVVYLDFPDGRYNDNGVLKQPYTNKQLSNVLHPDASGEVGVIKTNGVYSLQALKYGWNDRWNMLFDTTGVYNGTAHPDFQSHGDSAYGSMREYWKDASDNHFLMEPYPTHPNETDYKLKYGIINDFETVGGKVIIKNFMMPKNKYGIDNSTSYFRSFDDAVDLVDKGMTLLNEADYYVKQYYANSFDWADFEAKGGIVIYVMSGSSLGLKGLGTDHRTLVRGRYKEITDMSNSRIDGISITAHEYAHLALGWKHTSASRYCIMNAYDKHNKDCPQLPNPVLRMREGWINPIEIRGTQSITDLPPIETSKQCGVITIYGKPSAKPDWTCGEGFVVENRKQIGFDRKILEFNNPVVGHSNGGLLIWHYSPYHEFEPAFEDEGHWDLSYELIPANGATGVYGSYGDPGHFFTSKSDIEPYAYHKLDLNRTHSSLNLNTGIVIDSIEQNNYNDINSTIRFRLNYTITEPPNYTYVIQNLYNPNIIVNLHDTVYFHEQQLNTAFTLNPGTVVESRPVYNIYISGIKARGTQNNPIVFNSVGYGTYRTDYSGADFTQSLLQDSMIIDYCKFLKIQSPLSVSVNSIEPNKPVFFSDNIIQGTTSVVGLYTKTALQQCMNISSFKNNEFGTLKMDGYFKISMDDDVIMPQNSTLKIEGKDNSSATTFDFLYPRILLSNGNINLTSNLITNGNIEIGSTGMFSVGSSISLTPKLYFAQNTGINCYGRLNIVASTSEKIELLANSNIDTVYWNGIQCQNPGNIFISYAKILKAKTGFSLSDNANTSEISYSYFANNYFADIKLDNSLTDESAININHNVFEGNSDLLSSIESNGISNVNITDNTFNNQYSNGVSLLYSTNPIISSNQFYGTTQPGGGAYTGIYSYTSGGFYSCNRITNFYDGILLDNSSPYLLNNEIWNNGYGMYLTNNSIPILSPSYSPTTALYNAGYNKIYNNLSDEIYCDNISGDQLSYPYVSKGQNSIYDENGTDFLINLNYAFDPPLEAYENFWNGDSYYLADKFNPQGSVNFDQYLETSPQTTNCSPTMQIGDYSNMPSDVLLLGSANIDNYNKNYTSADAKYRQILSQSTQPYKTQNALTRFFSNLLQSRGNFFNAETYLESVAQQHTADTIVHKKSINLSISSKVEQPNYVDAISEYEQIIQTSNSQLERYYANIDKMRTMRLMLDTLLQGNGNGIGGDHFTGGNNMQGKFDNCKTGINLFLGNCSKLSKTNEALNRSDKKFAKINNLKQEDLNGLTGKEKIKVINEIILTSLVQKNALLNIALKRPLNRVDSKYSKKTQKPGNLIPDKYELSQNYPNPFNPTTTIKFAIPKNGMVNIKIYDIIGREIKTLCNEIKPAGYYSITFNASEFSSGIYFYRIQSGGFVQTKRMVLVK